MIFHGKEIPFPAIIKISFFKVLDMLEIQAKNDDKNISRFARELLKECEKYPELREGIEDRNQLEKYQPVVDKLSQLLFPQALLNNEIKGLIPPFDFEPFYLSTRFKNILENAGNEYNFELKNFDADLVYIYGASAILGQNYGYKIASGSPTTIDIEDKKAKIVRSYRLAYNGELMKTIPTDRAPKITEKDYRELLDDFHNVELWKEKFPPNSYIMRGIGIANLMDVTVDRSLTTITSNLLTKSDESIDEILQSLRNLFGIPDLESGFVQVENDTFLSTQIEAGQKGLKSFILGDDEKMLCRENVCKVTYEHLFVDGKPLVVPDPDLFDKRAKSTLSRKLKENNRVGSFIMAPLKNNDEFLGFIELVSPRKYDLNGSSIAQLNHVLPIFSMAISRLKREEQNAREAIIQQECTTIHPSVKWRFYEEADKYMKARFTDEQHVFSDIVFSDIYPLYGQLDIKGSSQKRNEAVKGDLLNQLKGIRKVLTGALNKTNMPVYQELIFRLDGYRDEVRNGMSSNSEHTIQTFMSSVINPVFDQLQKDGAETAVLVDEYRTMLDPELDAVYELRKKFDTSVNTINQTLASMLDEKQIEAQQMFPHYFERYKTDGVEYNIYIGQSIADQKEFDPVFLNNLQLWQLMVTCELETRFDELKEEIETPLEIASLILVYSNSLSVHFRMDEKRFDVEGAYNARYEIIKKRVDKAHIKGTKERITSPGKIAIIYNSDHDADIYRRYIEFLESKNFLVKDSLENLEVEDLQGITGLKAFRVEINYSSRAKTDFSVDELLEGIKAG